MYQSLYSACMYRQNHMCECRRNTTNAYMQIHLYLLINISEPFSDTNVGPCPNLARMWDRDETGSHLKKLIHPTPGGFRGLSIQCSFLRFCLRSFVRFLPSLHSLDGGVRACVWYFLRPIDGSSACAKRPLHAYSVEGTQH